MAFQQLGDIVWSDNEPQSYRAQHPWVLSHERETRNGIKQLMMTVIDPQVEDLRSFKLSIHENTVDMRTEYYTVYNAENEVGTLVKKLHLVTKEDGPDFLANVKVRRTKRSRGRGAGQAGDQDRVEDLKKPILMVATQCGHTFSISVDFHLTGLDTKLIRLLNQRTGSY